MRIALCFSGQNRTGHVTADNIKRYVGDLLPDCDVFAHFWDSETRGTGYANRLGAVSTDTEWHSPKTTNPEKNVEFFRQWAPRTMTVEEYDLQPSKKLWGGRRFDPVAGKYQVSMWRSVYEDKLKQDYAQKNQIVYDYTVRLRSDLVFDAIRRARNAGNAVSYDTNLRLRLWPLERARAVIHAAVALSDIALPGLDDAEQLTGLNGPEAICDFYLGLGVKVVALTLGKNGTMVAVKGDRRLIPARVVKAVDATGAGDTFDGAFLAEWVNTRDAFAAAHFANAAAALSTQAYGAVAPIPHRAAVEAFMTN